MECGINVACIFYTNYMLESFYFQFVTETTIFKTITIESELFSTKR